MYKLWALYLKTVVCGAQEMAQRLEPPFLEENLFFK